MVSDNLKVKLGDNEVTIKEKYVEISFVEEGIIKIENQSSSFSSIAENAQIIIDEDYVLNLDNGYFYYKEFLK
mgnify:CR=1 FL=1